MKRWLAVLMAALLIFAACAQAEEAQSSLSRRLIHEGTNLLPLFTDGYDTNGIAFKANNGIYTANGKAKKGAYLRLDGSTTSIPEWAYDYIGETIHVQYNTESMLKLVVRGYTKQNPDGFTILSTRKPASFVMPDVTQMKGLAIRLQVPSGYILDHVQVQPVLSWHSREKNPPMLTIIDDDGDMNYYEQLYPLAREKGISIASAVTTTRVESGRKRWMNWEQLRQCHADGMEILCHTYSHPKLEDLCGVSAEEITDLFQKAKNAMQENQVYTADIVVYSGSTGNMATVRQAAQNVFSGGALVGYNTTNFASADPFALSRYRIDYDYNYDVEALSGLIDELQAKGGWMIWMFHSSDENWNADRLNALSRLIDHAKASGVPIVTAQEGMQTYFGK